MNKIKKGHMLGVILVLIIAIIALGIILYKKQQEYRQASENNYNMAFYELVDYVENVETYLAKSLISSTSPSYLYQSPFLLIPININSYFSLFILVITLYADSNDTSYSGLHPPNIIPIVFLLIFYIFFLIFYIWTSNTCPL